MWWFILITCVISHTSKGSILSFGELTQCLDEEDILTCSEKLVVSMTVENGKIYETDYLDFTIDCVGSPTGECPCGCMHSVDKDCTCRDLSTPIRVSVVRTPVKILYPLAEPTIFNGRPHEVYIPTGYGSHENQCVDDEFHSNPTCGWARSSSATASNPDILDSQGFCCVCPFWGAQETIPRGYRDCSYSLSWLTEGTPGSAHCLRYDENWWYRGYKIGKYQLDFQIQVSIQHMANHSENDPQTSRRELISLSPSQTSHTSSIGNMHAELVGDLASYQEIVSLKDYWVMVPVQPGLSPNEIFTSNTDKWLILPPSLVSTSGQCDKVGVSYSSFRYQTNGCQRPLGSCLSNQIYDFETQDRYRVEEGLEPLYNIRRYGGGSDNPEQISGNSHGLVLSLPLKQMRSSVVVLSINADSVRFVTQVGHGIISGATICTFDGNTCGQFQAISGRGYLQVHVNNTSTNDAMFHVSVVNCSAEIVPILQISAAVQGMRTETFMFEVQSRTDTASNCSCIVVVKNALAQVTDTLSVRFQLTPTDYTPNSEQSDIEDKAGNPGNPPQYSPCSKLCPNVFNLKCSLLAGCWSQALKGFIILLGIVGSIYMTWVIFKTRAIPEALSNLFTRNPQRREPVPSLRSNPVYDGGDVQNQPSILFKTTCTGPIAPI